MNLNGESNTAVIPIVTSEYPGTTSTSYTSVPNTNWVWNLAQLDTAWIDVRLWARGDIASGDEMNVRLEIQSGGIGPKTGTEISLTPSNRNAYGDSVRILEQRDEALMKSQFKVTDGSSESNLSYLAYVVEW